MKCRLCENPAEPPKIFYCSDEHRTIFENAISWPHTRYLVLKRDRGKCLKCEKQVALHYLYYKDGEWNEADYIAHVHHKIPVSYLWGEILKAVEGLEGGERNYRIEQLKAIIFFHIDNLETLCEDCHREAHKSGWYQKFRFMETGQQTLDEIDYLVEVKEELDEDSGQHGE